MVTKGAARDLMLNDYIDYYGKPIDLFMHVWHMMKGLKSETYFKAVDEYCDFMEKFVPKRGKMIVEKLKKKLDYIPVTKKLLPNM